MNNAEVLIKFKADTSDIDNKMLSVGGLIKGNLVSSAIIGGLSKVWNGIKNVSSSIGNLAIQGGFDRALNIEQAEFKLKGLGHTAEEVEVIMDNALKSVKGTAYGLDEAATVAASSVAAGVKPGKDLERTLKLIGDAAAISGRSMTDIGAIFNKVAASGRMTAQELNQLTDAGIPMLQLLADNLGMTAGEVRDLVSAGKIGFPEFQDAIEKGMGGAALTMGQTFQGAVENTKAAMSRLGKTFMEPFLKGMTPVLNTLIQIIDNVAEGTTKGLDKLSKDLAKQLGEMINNVLNTLTPLLQNAIPVISKAIKGVLKQMPSILAEVLPIIIDIVMDVIDAIIDILPSLIPVLMDGLIKLLTGIVKIVPELVSALLDAAILIIQGLADALPELLPIVVEAIIDTMFTLLEHSSEILKVGVALIKGLAQGLLKSLPIYVGKLPLWIKEYISEILEMLPLYIKLGIELIVAIGKGIIEVLPEIVVALFDALGSLFVEETENIDLSEPISNITDWFAEIPQKIVDFFATLPEKIAYALGFVIGKIIQFGIDAVNWVITEVPKIINNIIKFFAELPGKVWNWLVQTINNLIQWGIQMIQRGKQAMIDLVNNIINTIKNLPGTMLQMGKDMIQGMINGVSNMGRSLVNKVRNLAGNVIQGMKDALGIHSPSTEFALLGKYSILGYTEALDDMKNQVQDTISDVFNLQPNISGTMSSNYSPNLNVVVNNNMEIDPLGQVVNNIKTFSGGAKNDYNWGATQ